MRVELIKGKKKSPAGFGTRTAGALAQGIDMPGQIAQSVSNLAGQPLTKLISKGLGGPDILTPISEALQYLTGYSGNNPIQANEVLKSATGTTQEQFEPQSTPESYLQRVLKLAPTAALTGGLGAVTNSAIGAVPATAAQYLGASPLVQDIAQIAGEVGAGIYKGKVPTLKGEQKEAYKRAKSFGEGKGAQASLSTEVSESITNKIEYAKNKIGNLIQGKDINPNQLFEARKKLYSLRKTVPENAQHYLDDLTKGINDLFTVYGAENPDFYNNLKLGDKLTQIKNTRSYIQDFIEKIPDKFLGRFTSLIKGPLKYIIGKAVGGGEKLFKNLYNHPVARSHYFNMAKAASQNNPASFLKAVEDFEKVFREEEPEFSKPKKSGLKIELLSGKKIR